jgi:hypothetical protein
VVKNWSENTSQLGIQPIWPPREKVYPGDVYIILATPANKAKRLPAYIYTVTSQRFDRLDLQVAEADEAQQSARHLMASMDSYTQGGEVDKPWPLPGYTKASPRLNGLVAFPGFSFAAVSGADLGINFTNSVWGAIFGAAGENSYTVSYTVPAAEYVSLPLRPVMSAFKKYNKSLPGADIENLREISNSLRERGGLALEAYIVVPNEVYYARAIDVTITSRSAYSGNLAATTTSLIALTDKMTELQKELGKLRNKSSTTQDPSKDRDLAKKEGSADTGETTETKEKENASEKRSLEQEILSLQNDIKAISKAAMPGAPGVTGSVTKSSMNGVTFSQAFYLPIAIGYKGLYFKLDDVLSKKPMPKGIGIGTTLQRTIKCDDCSFEDLNSEDLD